MGKGLCHQCRVRVSTGVAPISTADQKFFPPTQLQNGWRHSCTLRPRLNLELEIPQVYDFVDHFQWQRSPLGPWWMAIDMGTTGLELAAVDAEGIWGKANALNRQISMGSDVMTRLEWAQRNGVTALKDRLHKQLKALIEKFEAYGREHSTYTFTGNIWLAGNSAITAFVADQPIETLAVVPYQPHSLEGLKFCLGDFPAQTLPLLNSFVGGDLFAGLYSLWSQQGQGNLQHTPWILIDVGTNSEILFWDGEKLFVTSTPAGPAFEGSNISIGMRAEGGAIVDPTWLPTANGWQFSVIDNDVPRGICGSALIQLIDQAITANIVAPDGEVLKAESLHLTKELRLLQEDIREFQLAKSAIQTALEILKTMGQQPPQKLYLAGAFGTHLPRQACLQLGMLPELPIESLGNTSLIGTILWGQSTETDKKAFSHWLRQYLTPIDLATEDEFQERFVRNLHLRPHLV
jgi:uncharacterized 2Fe-2S/4Fe-4S cluster protein (DUF4445 family)